MAGVQARQMTEGTVLYFDTRIDKVRYNFPVSVFVQPRLKPGQALPKTVREVERDWLGPLVATVRRGENPRLGPLVVGESRMTIAEFIAQQYIPSYVEAEPLKRPDSIVSNLSVLGPIIGHMPLHALESVGPSDAVKFVYKVGTGAQDYALATRNRILRRVGHLTGWALARGFITKTPFRKGGVMVKQKGEAQRDRRVYEEEEQKLLNVALNYERLTGAKLTFELAGRIRDRVKAGESRAVVARAMGVTTGTITRVMSRQTWTTATESTRGPELHDLIVAALDTAARQGQLLQIRNRDVDWKRFELRLPKSTNKADVLVVVPFRPGGRVAEILEKRRFVGGPNAFVFLGGGTKKLKFPRKVWENVVLLAHDYTPNRPAASGAQLSKQSRADRVEIDLTFHDLRHECASRWLESGLDVREIQTLLGHAALTTTEKYLNIRPGKIAGSLQKMWAAGTEFRATRLRKVAR